MFWNLNLTFNVWAKVLATFTKIGRFYKSSGHSAFAKPITQ
jgi:hypothetical protein